MTPAFRSLAIVFATFEHLLSLVFQESGGGMDPNGHR